MDFVICTNGVKVNISRKEVTMIQLNTDVIANRNIGIVFHDDLAVCDPHSHTFFELAYIIQGNAIHTLDGNSDIVEPGDYVFIEPGSVHSFSKTKKYR